MYDLNETISFQWLKNSHCLGAAQLQLVLHTEEKTRKILYTSDLGALNTCNHYLENSEIPEMFNDIAIMESTYGDANRTNKRSRKFDVDKLKTAVNTVLERNGTVIMPCFSFSRTQEIMTTLYEIFGSNNDFNAKVIVDSVLSCEICKLYNSILTEQDAELWNKVCSWKNLIFVSDKEESKFYVEDSRPKIVISSSGFCTNGRIISYLKKYLKDKNSMIIFTGFVGDNPSYLSYRIKNCKDNKYISVNKEKIINKADCIMLPTFSSHANYNDLVKYGSSLNTNKLVLVHGEPESKKCLSAGLQRAICENNKSYKVITSNRGMIIHL